MDQVSFKPEKDLSNLNLSTNDFEKIIPILITYSEELNYWKIKHNKLIKKIQDIVC